MTGTLPGDADSAFIISLNSSSTLPATFPQFPYEATVTLTSGSQSIDTLGLATMSLGATATPATLDIEGATLVVNSALEGAFTVNFPSPVDMPFTGGGTIKLGNSATFEVGTTADSNVTIAFNDATDDTLVLDGPTAATPTAIAATISGFGGDNSIDLTSIPVDGATKSYDTTTQQLTITGTAGTEAILNLPGSFTTDSFSLVDDGAASVLVITCFAAGTLILTPQGERPIETLREGDLVVTADSATGGEGAERRARAIRWIGHRRVDLRRPALARLAQPVRVRRGAFGPGAPHRDLLLSPNHAVFAQRVLIPARYLVNGGSVSWAREMREVVYVHLELDEHAILFAEGLPAESLIPGADRSGFANGGGPERLHPDFHSLAWEGGGCAPLVVTGPILETVRARLAERIVDHAPALAAVGG